MRTVHKIAKNFLSLLLGYFLSGLIGLVTYAYLARVVGPGGFGKIAFAAAVVSYFSLLTDMGLGNLGIREIAKDRRQAGKYAINILLLKIILSLISFGLLACFVLILDRPRDIKELIFLFGLGFIVNAGLVSWVFQGFERMEIPSLMQPISSLLMLVFVLILIKKPDGLVYFPLINVFVGLFVFFILLAILLSSFRLRFDQIDPAFWRQLFAHALPMGISYLLIQIYYNFDTVLLGFMRTNEEVGLYNAAYKIILALISVSASFFSSIYPPLSRLFALSADKFQFLLGTTFKYSVLLAVPAAVYLIVFAEDIISLIYGPRFSGAVIAFQILMLAVCVIWLAGIFSCSLNAIGRQVDFLKATGLGAAVNIVLNFLLIPKLGMVGAAVATVISEIAVLLSVFWYLSLAAPLKVDRKKMLRYFFLAMAFSALVLLLSRFGGIIALLSGGAIYLPLLFIFKIIDLKEVGDLKIFVFGK